MANWAAAFCAGSGIALSIIDRTGPIIPDTAPEAVVPIAEPISWRIFVMGLFSILIILVVCVAVVTLVEWLGNDD